jgi:hypothetical protein
MPKPVKNKAKTPPKPKRPSDANSAAKAIIAEHLARTQGQPAANQMILDPETVIREHMRKLGIKGGKMSGAKRMQMPAEQRREIAALAARARWKKKKK